MAKITNDTHISLPMAVMLAYDDYDHNSDPNTISATSLLKSVRQIILSSRVSDSEAVMDVKDLIASSIGTAIHNHAEKAWLSDKVKPILLSMGYPQKTVDKIVINPSEPEEGQLAVYVEQRSSRQVGKWTVSGKFDMVFNGEVHDIKTTGTYAFSNQSKHETFRKQLSIYRWLNPTIVTKDVGRIQYVFLDWKDHFKTKDNYPPSKLFELSLDLIPEPTIDSWIQQKLQQVDYFWDMPEKELPRCTPEELWQGLPVHKYYSSPTAKRASKASQNLSEVQVYLANKGKGFIKTFPAQPTACLYCNASSKCSQFQEYLNQGLFAD